MRSFGSPRQCVGGFFIGKNRRKRKYYRSRPSLCPSAPCGEESCCVSFDFVLFERLRFAQDNKLGLVGVFWEQTKYRIWVGRGLAPAVNLHRTLRRGQNSPNSGTLRRGQAPALLYYNRHFPEQENLTAPYKMLFPVEKIYKEYLPGKPTTRNQRYKIYD